MISKRPISLRGPLSLSFTPTFTLQTEITQQPTLQMSNLEGRTALALQAYQRGRFSSLRAAAYAYDVPRTNLRRRNQGTPSRSDFISFGQKLTQTKKTVLIN